MEYLINYLEQLHQVLLSNRKDFLALFWMVLDETLIKQIGCTDGLKLDQMEAFEGTLVRFALPTTCGCWAMLLGRRRPEIN